MYSIVQLSLGGRTIKATDLCGSRETKFTMNRYDGRTYASLHVQVTIRFDLWTRLCGGIVRLYLLHGNGEHRLMKWMVGAIEFNEMLEF